MNVDTKSEALRRLKIIEGHLKRIIKMVDEEHYCPSILQQSSAVQSSLRRVDEILLRGHLSSCFKSAVKTNGGEKEIDELMDAFKAR